MPYTFNEHLHNYAVWAAARAVARNFTNTANVKSAIEKTELRSLLDSNEKFSIASFDQFHRETAGKIIAHLKFIDNELGEKASYGRAAKIIAIYIKTAIVIRDSGMSNLARIAHPPIDRILLTNANKEHKKLGLDRYNWTQLSENEYFELVEKLRTIEFESFWEVERYWSPIQAE
ncbi:hypothetical protein AQPE_2696 [Aquipluma nitroreducens]|uniref:Uncharacterized protein n=2 Tax=Aquipluma nitroreducens TaxID=2010828 RepID=A0A5K7SB61_9BACT|nr:hypothetical protein AQPE_2696 [Aquipluma nitroreducens]